MSSILENIFGPGGFLGGAPGDTEAQKAQAQMLLRMMGRETELYPELSRILGTSSANADQAFSEGTQPVTDIYPQLQDNITNLSLSPNVVNSLDMIRKSKLAALDQPTTEMIGRGITDLTKRGMQSSSTGEGLGRSVASAVAPQISQINKEFSDARVSMPITQAQNQFDLATGQGNLLNSTLREKYQNLLNPYLDMWGSSASLGASTPSVNRDPGQGGKNAASLIGAFA